MQPAPNLIIVLSVSIKTQTVVTMSMNVVENVAAALFLAAFLAGLRMAYLYNSDSKAGREYRRSWSEWRLKSVSQNHHQWSM